MTITRDQFTGCLLGLATGDALGAPHEGGVLEKALWRLIGRTRDGALRWTDDTRMALDLAESLLEEGGVGPDALAKRFAGSYHWSRGYGPGTARVLRRIRRGEAWQSASRAVHPNGSYGNGAAMRSPVVALFARDEAGIVEAARASALVTHGHPQAITGAVVVALATGHLLRGTPAPGLFAGLRMVCRDAEIAERLRRAASWILNDEVPAPYEVAARLGNGMAALDSCATAIYIALRHLRSPFEEMMAFVIACRGDVDTIGAMAGALWGAANGSAGLPPVKIEERSYLEDVAGRLFERFVDGG